HLLVVYGKGSLIAVDSNAHFIGGARPLNNGGILHPSNWLEKLAVLNAKDGNLARAGQDVGFVSVVRYAAPKNDPDIGCGALRSFGGEYATNLVIFVKGGLVQCSEGDVWIELVDQASRSVRARLVILR